LYVFIYRPFAFTAFDRPTIMSLSFESLRVPAYRQLVMGFLLTMVADNVEHVVSYWVLFQKFNSPVLGGFAVVSHWLPFLLFSLPVGALADRMDPRRMIQCGLALFMVCSLGWAAMFITDTLQVWAAMTLLVLHGLAGVLWNVATQIILYDLVSKETLPSAVRTLATARYLGLIVGPGIGGGLMLLLGPKLSLLVNALLYLPHMIWLINAPCGPQFRAPGTTAPVRPFKGWADLRTTAQVVMRHRPMAMMMLLAAGASWFISNSYQAQMPAYAHDFGHGDPGLTYSLLLAADALGALCAGLLWEYRGQRSQPTTQRALGYALIWAACMALFALTGHYAVAIVLLFVAGFAELTSNSTAQTIVQTTAPLEYRGRIIGLFNMAALGLRFGSGLTVGVLGGWLGIHLSLVAASAGFLLFLLFLQSRFKSRPA
jgi:MFS family permease